MKRTTPHTPPTGDSYLRIWAAVRKIPRGRVSTYGAIAKQAGMAGQARLVGYAMHNVPEGAEVPWQRVVNAQGKISFRSGGGGAGRQERLLIREGVRFTAGRIDLRAYGWPQRGFRPSR